MDKITDTEHLIACNECDLLLERPVILDSQKAKCPRCGSTLISARHNSIERTLALSIAGMILIFPANLFPLLTFELMGRTQSQTIFSSAMGFYYDGLWPLAVLVFMFTILVPACKLLLLFWVSFSLQFSIRLPARRFALRSYQHLDEWGMLEVYLVGVLVSVIKLVSMATLVPGIGIFCLGALILVTTMSSSMLDTDLFWHKIAEADHD
ncbi:paraquat-inducible protein A [Nitrincola nitratireducens]|uniref:Inner membrane protein yebS n=1 Tax=Nitrincola nitratireducens TaxID=1229521 RepID=W9V7N5_9GAMM|nr:paraquat-inducible protein A [Nitrincola nitratireducens]EXJ12112.1 Inner membrane protein yebS [Nitrincola nitratireducens]